MVGNYKKKSDKVYNMVKRLKERNCGITGVGFQLHVDLGFDDEQLEGVRSNMKRLNELGLTVHFTEIDVKCQKDFKVFRETGVEQCISEWTDELYEK